VRIAAVADNRAPRASETGRDDIGLAGDGVWSGPSLRIEPRCHPLASQRPRFKIPRSVYARWILIKRR
jgi:hypothetical protein